MVTVLGLTDQQVAVRDLARQVATEVIAPTAAARDQDAAWPHAELKALAELGFMGMLLPEAHGGADIGFVGYCLVLEEISAADGGVGTIAHVHNTSAASILRHGSDAQRQRYLPAMARGQNIGAFLLTEPQAGSDTAAFRASARRDGDSFVLGGAKQFISNGSEAGTALVLAQTDKDAGKRGFTIFIVDPKAAGYRVARVEDKMGQRTAHVAQIALEDLRVPEENVLGGSIGGGYGTVMSALSDGRIAIAAQAVGIARAALDAAVRYAREREAYGRPIIELQAVAFRLAEMAMQVDVARQYYLHAARLLEAGVPCFKEAAIAKLYASEMAERVCSDALQVHGGYGYLRDFPAERYCRDVRVCKIYEGTSDIQKLIISRNL